MTLPVLRLLLFILIIKNRDACNSSNDAATKDDLNDLKSNVTSLQENMTKLYDLKNNITEVFKELQKEMKEGLENLQANLTLELAINRKKIDQVIEMCDSYHRKSLRELSALNRDVTSIAEVLVYDKDQNIINEKHVDEFISELKSFTERAESIDSTYTQFLDMYKDLDEYNKRSIYKFIDHCFGYTSVELGPVVENMVNRLTGSRGVFSLMGEKSVEMYVLATRRMSTLEYLTKISHYMVSCEIRSALMASGAKGMAYFLDPDDSYEYEFDTYMTKMTERLSLLVDSIKLFGRRYTGRFWLYDTDKYKIGPQYVYFYNVFKGIYFRDNYCENVGKNTVTEGTQADHDFCNNFNKHACKDTIGNLHCSDDTRLKTDVQICYDNEDTGRLYQYVVYEKDQTRDCSGKMEVFEKDDRCTNCECYCNRTDAHRYISLDEMVTDVVKGRILTGLRFNKQDGAIGLDIQHSVLNEKGYVVGGSSQWIINKGYNKFQITPEKREIRLNEILTDNDRVITGVRFHEVENGVELQVRINDVIRCTKSKTLLSTTHKWISGKKLSAKYINLEKDGVGDPVKAELEGPLSVQSFSNIVVRISPTSFEDDGGQTVVPFFDTRKVMPWHPVSLRGVGLAYKTRSRKYAGFIAPYLVLADHSSQIDTQFLSLKTRSSSNGRIIFAFELMWTFILFFTLNLLI